MGDRRIKEAVWNPLAFRSLVLSVVLPQRPIEWAWWGALLLLIAMRVAEAGSVEITRDSDEAGYGISVATVPHLACAVLLPPPRTSSVAPAFSAHSTACRNSLASRGLIAPVIPHLRSR